MSAAEKATEIVAEVAEDIAEQATFVAKSSRGLSGREVGLVFGGLVVGAGLGGAISFIFSRKHFETKYSQISTEEIDEVRQHYRDKLMAQEATVMKPSLEAIVAEQGYQVASESPPMVVTPPAAVVEAAKDAVESERPLEMEPEELTETVNEHLARARARNVFEDAKVEDNWDQEAEKARRSPVRPYVIHIDEREALGYDEVTFTYYEDDDVLANERDEIVDNRNDLIGDRNLEKFGHGSGNADIVYVRNDRIETQFEIIRTEGSFAETVHGFIEHSHNRHRERNTRRLRFDDESPSG